MYLDNSYDHKDSFYSDYGCDDDVAGNEKPFLADLHRVFNDENRYNNVGEPEFHPAPYFVNCMKDFPGIILKDSVPIYDETNPLDENKHLVIDYEDMTYYGDCRDSSNPDDLGYYSAWTKDDFYASSENFQNWMQFGVGGSYAGMYPFFPIVWAIPTDYEITTVTGDVKNAGSSPNVYITLYGDKSPIFGGSTGQIALDDPDRNDFERGNSDLFKITAQDVGAVSCMEIRHDNSGEKPGWFLHEVVVRNLNSDKIYTFTVDQWLKEGNLDVKVCNPKVTSTSEIQDFLGQWQNFFMKFLGIKS